MNISELSNSIDALTYSGILTIDLDAIAENYKTLANFVKPTKCAAVIKADAYGLGGTKICQTLYESGCRFYFAAQLIEALALKKVLPSDANIAVLNGIQTGTEKLAAEAGIIPVLNSWESICHWKSICQEKSQRFPAIIQIDTGMCRLGLDQDELEKLIDDPSIFKIANIELIISHLALSDEPSSAANASQLNRLQNALAKLPSCEVAISASGGIFLGHSFHLDMVRPGIALYGVAPHDNISSTLIKPVMTLDARVIQTRHVKAGSAVGYGGSFVTSRPSIITTISVGYADGLHRSLGNKGSVYFNNHRLPIVGRVSMDSITVDATDLAENAPKSGDLIEIIGKNQSLDDIARDANTIAYEILTSLGHRYKRIYLRNGKPIDC